MKSIITLLIQIKLRLQLIKNVLKTKYNNSVTFSRSIIITEENDVMNLSTITQSWNLLKKNLSKWSAWCKHYKVCFMCENKNYAKSKCS